MPGGALKSLARKAGVWEVLASHCRSLCGLPVCRLGAHLGPLHQACLGAPLPQAAHHQAWAHRKLYSSGPHEVEGPGGPVVLATAAGVPEQAQAVCWACPAVGSRKNTGPQFPICKMG